MKFLFCLSYISCLYCLFFSQELDQLDVLIDYLSKQGSNAKVGFLSGANYQSIKRILPKNVKPFQVLHEEDLTKMVLNGSLIAALVSGLPEQQYHDSLHIFSSTLVTMQSILMAPDFSTDHPHGNLENSSTYDLSLAINAAIAKVQFKGIDTQLAIKNSPKEIIKAHTCKEDDLSVFPVPNKKDARGYLRKILETKVIKVLGDGPSNWGINDGNYLANPPVGFFPDLLTAIIDEFKNLSGPDNVTYGDITIERVYSNRTSFPWFYLFDGTAHITEPYFLLDAAYSGSSKSCTTDEDCLNANLPPSNKEKCVGNICRHPTRPRFTMLRSSCTCLGAESKFYTKRSNQGKDSNKSKNSLSAGGVVAIILLVLISVASISIIGYLIFRERRGRPMFVPFR